MASHRTPSILRKLGAAAKGRMFAPAHFSGYDQAYRFGKIIFRATDGLKKFRQRTKLWLRSPKLALRMQRLRQAISRRDWAAARAEAREIGRLAEQQQDRRVMEEVGNVLARLGEYRDAGRLRLKSRQISRGHEPKEWHGEKIAGTLVVDFVENEAQGMASTIRRGCLAAAAANYAQHCIALVQPRLVPLLSRSFPELDVRVADAASKKDAYARADKIAGFEHLNAYLGTSEEAIRRLFRPLKPDPATVHEFSVRYRRDTEPLIGISWGSSAYAKDSPPIAEWSSLLRAINAKFVSLQYGDVAKDLEELTANSGRTIVDDRSVDQLTDLDRFAAQVASLDGVVTISNTGAHLAGALGGFVVVIVDDSFRRNWPADTERTPYYPGAILIGKRGRAWDTVMREVAHRVTEELKRRRG